jgi:hypothetical protein
LTSQPVIPTPRVIAPVALRYALMPVDGNGIQVATVAAMLDDGAGGARARVLPPGETLPYGVVPVLLTDTTVHGVRFLLRALEGRLAGVARVPYLPVLRTVKGPDEALTYRDVQRAAAKLRRTIEGK